MSDRATESKFCQNYQDGLRTSFEREGCWGFPSISNRVVEDGKYDGELDLEPEPYQWFSPIYRQGYLAGVTVRFNELFSA